MACLGFKEHSEVVNKQGSYKEEGGGQIVSRTDCTEMWVSRSSKDHQCLYCLSCAAKVLIKNAKVIIYFTTVKGYRVIANVSFVYPA